MVVGNGLISSLFKEYTNHNGYVIFASGVSNSLEQNVEEFKREKELLLNYLSQNTSAVFVYFSTCSIYDKSINSSPYIQHKLEMEGLIKAYRNKFFIFRLSNIVGNGGNPNTIFNYLIHQVKHGTQFNIWKNATRNILSSDDVYQLINYFLINKVKLNSVINVANKWSFTIEDLVKEIELYLNMKANYSFEYKGEVVDIAIPEIEELLNGFFKERKKETYVKDLLQLYCTKE